MFLLLVYLILYLLKLTNIQEYQIIYVFLQKELLQPILKLVEILFELKSLFLHSSDME